MKRVVIVAPDFIPSSYPPALRVRFFSQHLAEFGWKPTVLTVDPKYYEWSFDEENNRLLPSSLHVIRTKAFPANMTRLFGIGDIGIRSLWHHWHELRRLCEKEKPDLIFIPMPPYVSSILGRWMYQRYKVPYVIDYIDPWVSTRYRSIPKKMRPKKRALSYALSKLLEPIVLSKASHITSVDVSYVEDVLDRYSWFSPEKITGIPYGGEASDFEYLRSRPRKNPFFQRHDGDIHLSYVGRGGSDMLPALRAIFEAIKLGLERFPQLFSRVKLHFIGTTYATNGNTTYQILPSARELGLQDRVTEHPCRVSYLDALQVLMDSHALLVVGSDAAHYTASKIFPYILARRPLLPVFHEASSVVSILQKTNTAKAVTFRNIHSLKEKVEEIYSALREILSLDKDFYPSTDWKVFESYSARTMTSNLAKVFDCVANKC